MSSSSSSSSEKKEIPTVRRSGRKRVSTTVKIGGYDVKRSNNYTVTESSYEFATHVEDPAKNKKPRTEKKPKKPSAPRKQTEAEEKRQRHNEEIRLCVEAKKQYRESFLAKHKDVLAPFIDEATKENLEEWSKKKMPAAPYEKEELFEQPELVTGGEMRDYQLAGLNFMVDLHNQGIASILGDEMGTSYYYL